MSRCLLTSWLFLAALAVAAQHSLRVTGGLSRTLEDYYTSIAERQCEDRSRRVAAIGSSGQVASCQDYIPRCRQSGRLPNRARSSVLVAVRSDLRGVGEVDHRYI